MLVDSHVHLDLTLSEAPDRMEWMKKNCYHPISWAFGSKIRICEDLEKYLHYQQKMIHQFYKSGLECHYLTGIHPRNIPEDLDLAAVRKLLEPFLDDPLCLGIGEIGLETGSRREMEVLRTQLEMADILVKRGKKFGIHTPRSNKTAITRQVLAELEPFADLKDSMVIDHCVARTIGDVLHAGFRAGITISPVKSSSEDIRHIVENYPGYMDRIMINTDSAGRFYEDLYALSRDPSLDETIKQRILKDNAAAFFNLKTP